jgi:hypothetical protein
MAAAKRHRGGLHDRIAKALNWSIEETWGFSLAAMRELVRPIDPELAQDITLAVGGGSRVARK